VSLIIVVLLLVLIVFAVAEVRAHRKHESIQTVIHAEVASLKTDVQKLDAKFDGGAIPK
jgi:uncharacterized membrane protein